MNIPQRQCLNSSEVLLPQLPFCLLVLNLLCNLRKIISAYFLTESIRLDPKKEKN